MDIEIHTLDLCEEIIEFDNCVDFNDDDYSECCYFFKCDGFHNKAHMRVLWL